MRLFFFIISLFFFIGCNQEPNYPPLTENTSQHRNSALTPFYHGVASGDPLQDRVIIWTRITPETQQPSIEVSWEVSTSEDFTDLIRSGQVETGPEKDYTVKVDVDGLTTGTEYYYRFKGMGKYSSLGHTKTASTQTQSISLGIVSCSNYEWGYFNGYALLAQEKDLDAVLHLGDYIYEYEVGRYGDTTIGRLNIPAHEILSVTDYRDRYSLYRLDPDLQAVHAAHPFISIWDDHEITNNSYKDGAENHQDGEGSYLDRKAIAKQVYYEWLPIRESTEHYRAFSFGNLADLYMLDERLAGRTQQADSLDDPKRLGDDMSMLGETQFSWLSNQLTSSQATWKLIGNQVIYSYLDWGYEGFRLNMDAWDGYPKEQARLAKLIQENALENVVFLTGDTHTSWAIEVTLDKKAYSANPAEGAFALELGTMSVNSANSDERFAPAIVKLHESKIVNTELNPHLKYTNMRDHGYLLLHLTESKALAQFKFVETNRKRSKKLKEVKAFDIISGQTKFYEVSEKEPS